MTSIRTEENEPTARCVHCGKRLTAETYDDLWRKYTDHVTAEHGKPRTITEAER